MKSIFSPSRKLGRVLQPGRRRNRGGRNSGVSRRSGRHHRPPVLILALLIAIVSGYLLPDIWPWADRQLRRWLPAQRPAVQPSKSHKTPRLPVATKPSDSADSVFVIPDAPPGDWVAEHLPFGRPSGECTDCTEVVREGYVLMHDNSLKEPRWVAWRLDPEDVRNGVRRSDDFREDPAIPPYGRATLADYKGSGFDRGHMAPAADMKKNRTTMSESFYLSNMVPQTPQLNRQEWRLLEEQIRAWLPERRQLWELTGPGFAPSPGQTPQRIGPGRVAVPTHCWRIVIDQLPDGSLVTLAVWMPNDSANVPGWRQCQVTIDDLEAFTGLDFLVKLPDALEEEIESRLDQW